MYTLKNPTKTDSWFVDLKEHSTVENALPLDSLVVRNDSNVIIYVDLSGLKVGEVQRYSSDSFLGRNFDSFKLYNPDGNQFEVNDLFAQMSKGQMMTSQPFNPQWDMMEDDLDKYSPGCDSRISLSATIALVTLKYWLNVQNDLIVQRRLAVAGTATMGTYETDFEGDVISGNCGINATVLDIQKLRKTLSNSSLNLSSSNCTINGLVFDLKKNPNDISKDYTIVTGGATAPNAYDDDMLTHFTGGGIGAAWTVYKTVLEMSFPSKSITNSHIYSIATYQSSAKTFSFRVQLNVNGVWTDIYELITGTPSTTIYEHIDTTYDLVTGVRFQLKINNTGVNVSLKQYDLSIF